MKYGDSLQQRSIPLWETYNIDYDDIKHLIKVRTTKGQAQVTAIPGHENEARALREFEDELYKELLKQYQRIDLFVQSKSGEIARRLTHLDKQIGHLTRHNLPSAQVGISVRRLEKFSNAEETALKVGEDIQALSRFVGAQRLAFHKLLKKYKKWTSSSDLGQRFQKEVLDQTNGFTKKDFEPLLQQWAEILAAVRAPFKAGTNWQSKRSEEPDRSVEGENSRWPKSAQCGPSQKLFRNGQRFKSNAKDLHSVCETGSNLDFDTALAVLPLGSTANKAVYWVHPDNLIQVHVILLQHTRLFKAKSDASSPSDTASATPSRSGSLNNYRGTSNNRADEETGLVICDDLQRFAIRQSSVTISDSENLIGNTSDKAAASIRYCSNGEVIAVIDTFGPTSKSIGEGPKYERAKLKRKAVRQLFSLDPRSSFLRKHSGKSGVSSIVADNELESAQKLEQMRTWFLDHEEVRPLVQLCMRRTRFVGLYNSEASGLWATVDKNVSMRRFPEEASISADDLLAASEDGPQGFEKFPHALMEIRYEGNIGTDIITLLDESHLTERVRGFSLITHAVATVCKPQGMTSPYWLPALQQDIRKVPASTKTARPKTAGSQMSPNSTRTQKSSTSATSLGEGPSSSNCLAPPTESSATSVPDMLESPPLSAFKKKRYQYKRHPLSVQINQVPKPQQQRYWNEFDDGDEGSEEEVYTLFVNPNNNSAFPGAASISKIVASISNGAVSSVHIIKSWLGSEPKAAPNEQDPLLTGCHPRSLSGEYDSDLEDELTPDSIIRDPQRRYSTFPNSPHARARQSRETLLFRFCVASFLASYVVLAIAAILTSTGRRKSFLAVRVGVLLGVVWSLIFAVVGVGTTIARTKKLDWMHRATVILVVAIVCVGNGIVLAILGSS